MTCSERVSQCQYDQFCFRGNCQYECYAKICKHSCLAGPCKEGIPLHLLSLPLSLLEQSLAVRHFKQHSFFGVL